MPKAPDLDPTRRSAAPNGGKGAGGDEHVLGATMRVEEKRTIRRRRRAALVGAAVLGGVAWVAWNVPVGSLGMVTVTQTALPDEGACVPTLFGRSALTYVRESTSEHFRLTVVNRWHLCEPVEAVAAVYGMPTTGAAWPQRLLATQPFSIEAPSTTVITFAKDCRPAQYDVVTGATPPVIDLLPIGPAHGPLLFPGDLATAEQYPGSTCDGSTTTSTTEPPVVGATTTVPGGSSTTTTSPSTTTTSTTLPGSGATTTVPSGGGGGGTGDGSSSGPAAQVSPAVETRASGTSPSSTSASASGSPLALTGAQSLMVAVLGAALLAAGLVMLVASRRTRRRRAVYWPIAIAPVADDGIDAPVTGLFTTRPTR